MLDLFSSIPSFYLFVYRVRLAIYISLYFGFSLFVPLTGLLFAVSGGVALSFLSRPSVASIVVASIGCKRACMCSVVCLFIFRLLFLFDFLTFLFRDRFSLLLSFVSRGFVPFVFCVLSLCCLFEFICLGIVVCYSRCFVSICCSFSLFFRPLVFRLFISVCHLSLALSVFSPLPPWLSLPPMTWLRVFSAFSLTCQSASSAFFFSRLRLMIPMTMVTFVEFSFVPSWLPAV